MNVGDDRRNHEHAKRGLMDLRIYGGYEREGRSLEWRVSYGVMDLRISGYTNPRKCGLGQENPAIKNHFFFNLGKITANPLQGWLFLLSL